MFNPVALSCLETFSSLGFQNFAIHQLFLPIPFCGLIVIFLWENTPAVSLPHIPAYCTQGNLGIPLVFCPVFPRIKILKTEVLPCKTLFFTQAVFDGLMLDGCLFCVLFFPAGLRFPGVVGYLTDRVYLVAMG